MTPATPPAPAVPAPHLQAAGEIDNCLLSEEEEGFVEELLDWGEEDADDIIGAMEDEEDADPLTMKALDGPPLVAAATLGAAQPVA